MLLIMMSSDFETLRPLLQSEEKPTIVLCQQGVLLTFPENELSNVQKLVALADDVHTIGLGVTFPHPLIDYAHFVELCANCAPVITIK